MDARKRRFGKRRFLGNKYGGFRVGGQAGGPINQLEVAHVREAPEVLLRGDLEVLGLRSATLSN